MWYRQVPVSGLLNFISSVARRKPQSMGKLKRTYEDIAQLKSNCSTLTVLQWNVLADGLAQNGDFQRVSSLTLAALSLANFGNSVLCISSVLIS